MGRKLLILILLVACSACKPGLHSVQGFTARTKTAQPMDPCVQQERAMTAVMRAQQANDRGIVAAEERIEAKRHSLNLEAQAQAKGYEQELADATKRLGVTSYRHNELMAQRDAFQAQAPTHIRAALMPLVTVKSSYLLNEESLADQYVLAHDALIACAKANER